AWSTGPFTLHLHHYTRDLTTLIEQTTIPWPDTVVTGPALFPNGTGATLAGATISYAVTTSPLTVTQAGTHDWIGWASGAWSTLILPDGAALATAGDVVTHPNGTVAIYAASSDDAASLYPTDDPNIVWVGSETADPPSVHELNLTTGVFTHLQDGPNLGPAYSGLSRPDVYLAMNPTSGGPHSLAQYDASGNVTAPTPEGWPGPDWEQWQNAGSIHHPSGGWLSTWT